MKKIIAISLIMMFMLSSISFAADKITTGEIKGRTVAAGLCSLILWPGIGQAINSNPEEKVITHALLGLIDIVTKIPVTRIWSGYDGLVDRKGGYFDGKL